MLILLSPYLTLCNGSRNLVGLKGIKNNIIVMNGPLWLALGKILLYWNIRKLNWIAIVINHSLAIQKLKLELTHLIGGGKSF